METLDLNGSWSIRSSCDKYNLPVEIPSTFFKALEENGYWEKGSLFWRDNNQICKEIAERDFLFTREFTVSEDFLNNSRAFYLNAHGLDTLATIHINGVLVGTADNMHRRYRFEIKDILSKGRNYIQINFKNTLEYIAQKQNERFIWSITDTTVQGFNRIRKNSASFGWDWGPVVPDVGIWRDISITGESYGRMLDPQIVQIHEVDQVSLIVSIPFEGNFPNETVIICTLTSPDGNVINETSSLNKEIKFIIKEPQLWWPNGYGKQDLYVLETQIARENLILEKRTDKIGLRTIELDQSKDAWGNKFGFNVNGITIFAMGGNIIPLDVYLTRPDVSDFRRLLQDCIDANFNCVRIWGGGIYPDSEFYDICDELGLLVWQDLMFACALYESSDINFRMNITEEIIDNISRIRNHACLALICGNNEMEWAFTDWPQMTWNGRDKSEYTYQYDYLIPEIVQEICPDIPYWKASPSSGGFFDVPNDPDRGDVHYWDIWHGGAPFTDFRKYHFRFLSEYGFQSFPSYKTVCTYTLPEDRNPFSVIMEDHQRNGNYSGNQQIMKYASEYFLLGKDMDSICYISQLSQAEAGRYAVEHMRQNRGRCLGSTYWQVNDVWPCASWSSIDYYGRWKALHYIMKRAYAPVLLSVREEGTSAEIYITTEGQQGFNGSIIWQLMDNNGKIYDHGCVLVEAEKQSAISVFSKNFSELLSGNKNRERYLSITLKNGKNETISTCKTLFVKYKQFNLNNPELGYKIMEKPTYWEIEVKAARFAKFIELDFLDCDAKFSDNYFDLDAGEVKSIKLLKSCFKGMPMNKMKIRSLFDSFQ